jgi:uncharacterized protein
MLPSLPRKTGQAGIKEAGGENTNRTSLIAITLAILVAALAVQTYASSAGHARATGTPSGVASNGASGSGTIQVQGAGEISVQPDRGIVNIGVGTDAGTASAAVQSNANTSNAVISALNGIGIDSSNIQTTYYYISPNYAYGSSSITGYHVTNEFQVTVIASGQTVQQLGLKIGQVIDTASSNGANQIYGVQFEASATAIQQAQQTALQYATQDASQKAHTIATSLGVTITGVVSVTTTPSYYPEPVFFGAQVTTAVTPILPPQSLTISATVQVTFSIS